MVSKTLEVTGGWTENCGFQHKSLLSVHFQFPALSFWRCQLFCPIIYKGVLQCWWLQQKIVHLDWHRQTKTLQDSLFGKNNSQSTS